MRNKNIFTHLFFYTILIIINSNISFSQSDLRNSLFNKLSELKAQTHVNAVIAGVWKGDEEILSVAMGESMTNVPAAVDMHFRIGGVSETFFGTLVMMLVDQGKIRLDDKISKWMPQLYESEKVTIEMLIKNTAGYKDYVLNKAFIDTVLKSPFKFISREEILNFANVTTEINFPPGTKQSYSHTEFTILGIILELATGKSMADLYEENIFTPLGLNNTGYSRDAELPSPVLHAYSSDRKIYEDATYWSPSWTGESGPLYSNLNDLANWAKVFGKGKLLSQESFDKLLSRPPGANRPDLYFASGFVVSNGWYAQNPSFNGYSGGFGYYPKKEFTVIVFSTETDDPSSSSKAFSILSELIKILTPDSEINF